MESTQEHKSQGNVFHPGWIVIGLLAITTIWMSYPFWLAEFLRLIQWTGQDHVAATGQFGDSFGALNTLFSGMAFAVLIVTLLLQQQEMRAQRVEFRKNQDIAERQETALRRQTFEATLFQWLGLHHQLVDRINFEVVRHHYRSREGFQSEVNEFYGRNALDRMWNDNIVHEFVRRIAGMGKQKKQVADLTTAVHDILEKNAPSSVTAHAFNKSLDAASREDLVLVVQMFRRFIRTRILNTSINLIITSEASSGFLGGYYSVSGRPI